MGGDYFRDAMSNSLKIIFRAAYWQMKFWMRPSPWKTAKLMFEYSS